MKISASLRNSAGAHAVRLQTNDTTRELSIAPKPAGRGSSVNGGELLMLALATCYCNDIYREAARRGIDVVSVEVEAASRFGGEGEPASDLTYSARIEAHASEAAIRELAAATDRVAEIQNTLRLGMAVTLNAVTAISRDAGVGR